MRAVLRNKFLLLMLSALFLFSCNFNKEERYRHFMESGNKYFENGELAKALVEFKNALQLDPTKAEAYRMIGVVSFKLNDYKTAYNNFLSAVEKKPDDYVSHYYLARIYILANNLEQAKQELTFLRKFPEKPETQLIEALVALREGNYEEAEKFLTRLSREADRSVNLDPDVIQEAFVLLATIYRKQGKLEEASELLDEALKILPSSSDNRVLVKLLKLELDSALSLDDSYLEQAKRLFEFTVKNEIHKRNPSLFRKISLGVYRVFLRSGDPDSAMQVLKESYSKLRDYRYVEYMAALLFKENRLQEAKEILEEYVENNPNSANVYRAMYWLAKIDYALGNKEASKRTLQKVLEKNASFVPALVLLGQLYKEEDNCKEAVTYFNTAFHVDSKNEAAFLGLFECYLKQNNVILAEYVLSHLSEIESPILASRITSVVLDSHEDAKELVANVFMKILKEESYKESTPSYPFIDVLVQSLILLSEENETLRDKVLFELEAASRRREDDGFWSYEMAKAEYLSGNCRGAFRRVSDLMAEGAVRVETLILLGRIVNSCGENLVSDFERKWRENRYLYAGIVLAQYYLEKGEYEQAYRTYRDIVKQVNSEILFNNYASLVGEYGSEEEIKTVREKMSRILVSMETMRPEFLDTLAWLEYRVGRCKNAHALLSLLDKDAQNMLIVKYHRAMVLICLGRPEGKELLVEVLESKKPFLGRERAKRALSENLE